MVLSVWSERRGGVECLRSCRCRRSGGVGGVVGVVGVGGGLISQSVMRIGSLSGCGGRLVGVGEKEE